MLGFNLAFGAIFSYTLLMCSDLYLRVDAEEFLCVIMHRYPLCRYFLTFFYYYTCLSLVWGDQRESPCTYPGIRGIMMVMPGTGWQCIY
jgi:hypothetical protein